MSASLIPRQARSRAVLSALGIAVWGARSDEIQRVTAVQLWGKREEDVIAAEAEQILAEPIQPQTEIKPELLGIPPHTDSSLHLTNPKSPVAQSAAIESASTHIARTESLLQTTNPVLHKTLPVTEKPSRQPFAQTIAASEAVHVEQVLRFSLEARVIGEWVVLVSVQALNHPDRRTLWQNINQAFQSADSSNATEAYRLDWPLAEGARWQHNVGAQAALMGFLTRFGTERRVGLMGELPDSIIPEHLERLPSLDELLQAPLKKRSLWRLLSGQVR